MSLGWTSGLGITLLVGALAGGHAVHAQTGRQWVDPPAGLEASPQPAAPQSEVPATPVPPPSGAPDGPRAAQPVEPSPSPPVQSARPTDDASGTLPPARSAQTPQERPPEEARSATASERQAPRDSRLATHVEAARELAIAYLNSWSAQNQETLESTSDFYADRVVFHGREMSIERLVREKRRFVRRWPERAYNPRMDTMKVDCEPTGQVCTVHTMFDYLAANPKRSRRSQGVGALQLVLSFVVDRPIITAENSVIVSQIRRGRNLALENSSND